MSHSRRTVEPLRSGRGGADPDRREPAGLSPAVVTLVRHRIATGFYDTPPVRRAIAQGVLADAALRPPAERPWS